MGTAVLVLLRQWVPSYRCHDREDECAASFAKDTLQPIGAFDDGNWLLRLLGCVGCCDTSVLGPGSSRSKLTHSRDFVADAARVAQYSD